MAIYRMEIYRMEIYRMEIYRMEIYRMEIYRMGGIFIPIPEANSGQAEAFPHQRKKGRFVRRLR
jgi:hypothetical protein